MSLKSIFLLAVPLFCNCGGNNPLSPLELINEFNLSIPEPSGLTLGKNKQSLWVVNDPPNNEIYEITLEGAVIRKLSFKGDDLEGVTYDSDNDVLWVAEEQKREVLQIALDGTVLTRRAVNVDNSKDQGLEGIFLSRTGTLWVVNEKKPGRLISLNTNFQIDGEFPLNFAKDYSGLCQAENERQIWIISDESEKLVLWDKDSGVKKMYELPFKKAEGVAVDSAQNLVYIVSDSEEKLYIFRLGH